MRARREAFWVVVKLGVHCTRRESPRTLDIRNMEHGHLHRVGTSTRDASGPHRPNDRRQYIASYLRRS